MPIKPWELLGDLTRIVAIECSPPTMLIDDDAHGCTAAELLRIDARVHDLLMGHYREAFNFGGKRCDD